MRRVDYVSSFNPRPREGATRSAQLDGVLDPKFQSTPPRRGDERQIPLHSSLPVSIHAPAKGRLKSLISLHYGLKFQSTPPRRGDLPRCSEPDEPDVSIHAPAKGRPIANAPSFGLSTGFNPRPREGATWSYRADRSGHIVSIHAPAKGRRDQPPPAAHGRTVSIHAPAKGRPECTRWTTGNPKVSIHAPAKGRLSPVRLVAQTPRVSIHAPAKGRPTVFDPRGI